MNEKLDSLNALRLAAERVLKTAVWLGGSNWQVPGDVLDELALALAPYRVAEAAKIVSDRE